MNKSQYEIHAEEFLAKHGLTFSATFIGTECPAGCNDPLTIPTATAHFPRRDHIHGYHYRCTITRSTDRVIHFDFWNSYNDEEHNYVVKNKLRPWEYPMSRREVVAMNQRHAGAKSVKKPTPYDLLATITKYDPGSFEDFCADFGYDTDSRRAEETYRAVDAEWHKVNRFFTSQELAELQEIS